MALSVTVPWIKAKPPKTHLVGGGLVALVIGGDLVVQNASALALKAKVSPLVVGLTIVAMGTSAPELFASLQAAWRGDGSIAIGNVRDQTSPTWGLRLA